MVKLGKYNRLAVVKNVDFGAYLDGGDGVEILLPARYIGSPLQPGDEIEVFIYKDSEGRLIATTEHPYVEVGQFAFLQVSAVNNVGAFLDWGLPTKELLVPYSEQKGKLREGMIVPVYVYVDDATKRIVASAKIEKYLGNSFPEFRQRQEVQALVYTRTEIGYKAVVNNLFSGMIYENEIYRPLEIGETVKAYVKNVRPDGKLDLTLSGTENDRVNELAERIMDRLDREPDRFLPMGDFSTPETIKEVFQCSKKDFKKAIGHLFRDHRITISPAGIKKES